jgi:tagaturonate reductase
VSGVPTAEPLVPRVSKARLGARLLDSGHRFPDDVTVSRSGPLPERVLQFGEGNFLRAFVDWMLDRMNTRGLFGGRVVVVQPIATGMAEAINAQQGLYTVILRGIERGEVRETREIVSSVSRCLNPYTEYEAFLSCAENPELRFVVSNTTEAGIRTDPADRLDSRPAPSFPGKLTQLLYARFLHFAGDPVRGLVMLPCELVEKNGQGLERAVRQTAESWNLPAEFTRFLTEACTFTSTLVDRIVTGYPKDEAGALAEKLGYEDPLLVAGEIFHSWVIESPRPLERELPLKEAGLNVIWTRDIAPYRERKVRILNGAHTMTALAAYLAGKETVRECMQDPLFASFVERGIQDEILPTLELPRPELQEFAEAVVERFKNPFIQHYLMSISLNSVSKYKARILGTVIDYMRECGKLPPRLTFALAALIVFYRGREIRDSALIGVRGGVPYRIQDEAHVLEFFRDAWAGGETPGREFCSDLVRRVLSRTDFWDEDLNLTLPGLRDRVAEHVHAICNEGLRPALERVAG